MGFLFSKCQRRCWARPGLSGSPIFGCARQIRNSNYSFSTANVDVRSFNRSTNRWKNHWRSSSSSSHHPFLSGNKEIRWKGKKINNQGPATWRNHNTFKTTPSLPNPPYCFFADFFGNAWFQKIRGHDSKYIPSICLLVAWPLFFFSFLYNLYLC